MNFRNRSVNVWFHIESARVCSFTVLTLFRYSVIHLFQLRNEIENYVIYGLKETANGHQRTADTCELVTNAVMHIAQRSSHVRRSFINQWNSVQYFKCFCHSSWLLRFISFLLSHFGVGTHSKSSFYTTKLKNAINAKIENKQLN